MLMWIERSLFVLTKNSTHLLGYFITRYRESTKQIIELD